MARPLQKTNADGTPAADQSEEKALPNTLKTRIANIATHCHRQLLASDPNRVIEAYLVHVASPSAGHFEHLPHGSLDMDELPVSYSSAWEKGDAMTSLTNGAIEGMKPAEQRHLLAHRMLRCLTPRYKAPLGADGLRKHFHPDADFLKTYPKWALVEMINATGSKEVEGIVPEKVKAADLAKALWQHAIDHKDWLPLGFEDYT